MRTAIFFCLLLFPGITGFSQKQANSFGLYTSFINSGKTLFSFINSDYRTREKNTFLIGAEYSKPLNSWLKMNIGIEYASRSVDVTIYGSPGVIPGRLQYLSVPFYLRADVLKYLFFSFGVIVDVMADNDVRKARSSLGFTGGTGIKYDFKNKTTVFLHPFYELHGVTSGPDNFLALGIRTGIAYRL